jgi:gas vesicle protein
MVMKEGSEYRKSSILIPALIGSAVGAGVALLLAPQSGKETRNDLKRFAANTRDRVAGVIDEGRDLYEEGRESVARAVKAGKETYDEGAERFEKLMHKKERSLMMPILVSGIIGAGIALMLAPKTGKLIRKDLKQFAVNTRDKFASAIDKGKVLYLEEKKEAAAASKKAHIHEKAKLRHVA